MPLSVMSDDYSFAQLCQQLTPAGKGLTVPIPADWRQGRTAYGGLSAGLTLQQVLRENKDLPPLRSAIINFVGPVTDDPTFTSQILRSGRNVTSIAAQAHVAEQSVLAANFAFGSSRESNLNVTLPAPDAPPPEDCQPFTPAQAKDFVPSFFHKFETKLIAGHRPVSGAKDGYIRTWSRHRHLDSRDGVASLLCLGDVLPPAAMPMFKQMGAVSSMTWMFNILSDDISTDDGWWQVETKLSAGQGGYSSQVMRMWNTRGELIVEGMQNVTMFI